MNKLSIIVPVYNEEKTIDEVLHRILNEPLAGWQKEIIVINDGSTDKTRKILDKWRKKVTVIEKDKNEGKGSALSIGFRKVTGDIVLIQDADLEYSPSDYPVLLSPFANERVSVVYGSRFLGPHLSTMFIYAQGNKFITFVANILFNTNLTDMETGFKVMRREVVDGMQIDSKRFEAEPEITAKILKRGYQIYEVPISYMGRTFEEGKKLTWKDGLTALFTLIRYRVF